MQRLRSMNTPVRPPPESGGQTLAHSRSVACRYLPAAQLSESGRESRNPRQRAAASGEKQGPRSKVMSMRRNRRWANGWKENA